MQYIITAYDYTDEHALDRRMSVRPDHVANIMKVKEYGKVISAGGLLDENRKMKGSFLIMEFATMELLEKYLDSEPYIKNKVWEKITIEVCNVVIEHDEIVGK